MSRCCELFQGGNNGFEIKDIEGYKKWKDSIIDEFKEMLHDVKDEDGLTVYVGNIWGKKFKEEKLDTFINHFHPNGDGWNNGNPQEFWCGLSLFVKEPIELLQTDEEFPYLTKPFGGSTNNKDEGVYRLWAFEGKMIVENIGFIVLSKKEFKAKDVIDEEVLEFVSNRKDLFCDKCKKGINPVKFDFKTRGYYEEVKSKHNFNQLCKNCYEELKKPFAQMKKIEQEIEDKKKELEEIRSGKNAKSKI